MWKRGDIVEFRDDGLQLVATADGTGGAVAVAVWDGTDTNHTSGELIVRNPLFSTLLIQDKINETVDNHLWPHVWSWHTGTISYTSGTREYALAAYIVDVVRVYQDNLSSSERLHVFPQNWYETFIELNTAVSANENSIQLHHVHDAAATVYYEARRKPNSADLANLDARLDDLIAHNAAALCAEAVWLSAQSDPNRRGTQLDDILGQQARVLSARFFTLREQLKATLRDEIPVDRRFNRSSARLTVGPRGY